MNCDFKEKEENLARIFESTIIKVFTLYKIPRCIDIDEYAKRLASSAMRSISKNRTLDLDEYKIWENQFVRDVVKKKFMQALVFMYKILEKTAKNDQKIIEYTSVNNNELVFVGKRTTENNKPFDIHVSIFPIKDKAETEYNFELGFILPNPIFATFLYIDVRDDFETKIVDSAIKISDWIKRTKEDLDTLR